MFAGTASITTNSFAINVDVTDTSVELPSARTQCSLAGAGFFSSLFLESFEKSLAGAKGGIRLYAQLICCAKGPWVSSLARKWPFLFTHSCICCSRHQRLKADSHTLKLSRDSQFFFTHSPTPDIEKKPSKLLICHADKPRILRLSYVSNDAN